MLRKRRRYTGNEKAEIWDRWQAGESITSIAQSFGTGHSAIGQNSSFVGGIRLSPRRRARVALSLADREGISGIAVYIGCGI